MTALELSNILSCREQYRLRAASWTECRPSNGLKSQLTVTCITSDTSHSHTAAWSVAQRIHW